MILWVILSGIELLIAIAKRLESNLPNIDILSRFGGDEFAILLTNLTEPEIDN
jgi:FOG: GGDEF domain